MGKWRYGSMHSKRQHQMEMSDQLHALAALPWDKCSWYPLDWRLGGAPELVWRQW